MAVQLIPPADPFSMPNKLAPATILPAAVEAVCVPCLPRTLMCVLHPYQKQTLYWMPESEKGVHIEQAAKTLHPCWAAYRLTHKKASSVYVNIFSGKATARFPGATKMAKGGVVMDNGLIQVTLSKPEGIITGVRYDGVDNLLDTHSHEDRRGYWDITWNEPGGRGMFDIIKGTKFRIILRNETRVEISFTRTWNPSQTGSVVPLNIDKRFVMLQDSHGFYTYSIYEHLEGWPNFDLGVTRIVFKLKKDMFRYMAVDERRQRRMPLPDDHLSRRSQVLAYLEAVRLVNPSDSELLGEVDDKYQYSSESEDIKVHGWMSTSNPPVGFWHITPSHEFRSGGPFKQELTSHVGLTTLTASFY